MATHTPGPWFSRGRAVLTGAEDLVACADPKGEFTPPAAVANARLIAAAPDLLVALRHLEIVTRTDAVTDAEVLDLEQTYGADTTWSELVDAAKAAALAAIAKAGADR